MRIKFDPSNPSHLRSYRIFLTHKTWLNGCIYELEWPYHDIPVMIQAKIIQKHLDKLIKLTDNTPTENKTKRQRKKLIN